MLNCICFGSSHITVLTWTGSVANYNAKDVHLIWIIYSSLPKWRVMRVRGIHHSADGRHCTDRECSHLHSRNAPAREVLLLLALTKQEQRVIHSALWNMWETSQRGHWRKVRIWQAEERKGHSGQEGQAVQGNRDGWKVAGTQAVVLLNNGSWTERCKDQYVSSPASQAHWAWWRLMARKDFSISEWGQEVVVVRHRGPWMPDQQHLPSAWSCLFPGSFQAASFQAGKDT